MSFGAVLTFTAASMSGTAQEAFGGTLSVMAVAFVTAMVFWMRRSARNLSGEIKEKVTGALAMGAGMLSSPRSSRWAARAWRPRCSCGPPPGRPVSPRAR